MEIQAGRSTATQTSSPGHHQPAERAKCPVGAHRVCDNRGMTVPIGSEALIPNPALRPFAGLVGEWQTSGTHPLMPDTVFHGRTSFGWHEGGAFLIMHSEIDEPGIPSAVAVIGASDAAEGFFMLYFDERGVSRKYDVTVLDNVITWHRDDPGFAQRATLTIEADGLRITSRGAMARDGADWEDDLSLTFVRS